MESESFIKKTARTTMKVIKRILLIALALGIATLAFCIMVFMNVV